MIRKPPGAITWKFQQPQKSKWLNRVGNFPSRTPENDFSLDIWKQRLPLSLCHGAAAVRSVSWCPTLWPHGLQPTRLLCPQKFPGKNTGVHCHFLGDPGDLPDPGSQHRSPTFAGIFFTTEPPGALLLLFIPLAVFFLFTGLLKKILYIVTKNFPLVFTFFFFFSLSIPS